MGRSAAKGSVWQWKIPPGSLGLRLLTSSILLEGLGVILWGR